MVGLEEFGKTLGYEGQTETKQWTFVEVSAKQDFSNACLLANSSPFSATEQRRRRKRRKGSRQEFAVYAASSPLTNSPCALWHRQSCWLCYCSLLTALPEWQVGPVCLEWDTQRTGSSLVHQLTSCLAFLTETGSNNACYDSPLPVAISSTACSSNILTRLIASIRDDKCPEIVHCNQVISSS